MLKRFSLSKFHPVKIYDMLKGNKSQKLLKIEEREFSVLEAMSLLADSMSVPPLQSQHPLRSISYNLKEKLGEKKNATHTELMDFVTKYAENENKKYGQIFSNIKLEENSRIVQGDGNYIRYQTALRIENLKSYFQSIQKAVESGEISSEKLTHFNLLNLIDATLLGSGAERVSVHLRLYRSHFTQAQLQHSFYSLYNPELDALLSSFRPFPSQGLPKDYLKRFTKAQKIYLLDTLELNSKSRCVFAWSDKNYVTFQDLDDAKEVSAEDIFPTRQKYFEESNSIGKNFIESYIKDRRVFYSDKEETRQNIRLGFFFLIGTCLIDWYLCSI